MTTDNCPHDRTAPEAVDQTLGVVCLDCDGLLHWCWMDNHIPEFAWNRACKNDAEARPCEQNREDHCAVCKETIAKE